ncbi:hypothetical protein DACRYDRAFT_103095 [Dacryopinax primogenitus]|uniref:DUF7330 domain-containing protein n=1 Tax=Dacryopinax primogenitus (strain DJM 731) TaxID=1858805 RepID=M5GGV5_DACPD|nr:uncharacterized protein DACRYDRAFT_103095 [Dacryopinax primogenitus]EJU06148.1 hypothetical protein DACRYDRAFT_103095 [Dacryopinax primogenitus]
MIITSDNPEAADDPKHRPGPSGRSTSQSAVEDEAQPPPYSYSPRADPRVDLLEGEGEEDTILIPAPSRPLPSPFPAVSQAVPVISNIPPNLPRQNRLRIYRDNSGIRDTFVIDPTLPAPPGSHDKALSVTKGMVELEGLSMNGSINFRVAECPADMRISIHVESRNGSVALFLPATFRGPLTIGHENGNAWLTPPLRTRTRTLDETAGQHRCWVGEWGEDDDPNWVADECTVESHNGSVKVGYWSAEAADMKQQVPKGAMEKAFGQKK